MLIPNSHFLSQSRKLRRRQGLNSATGKSSHTLHLSTLPPHLRRTPIRPTGPGTFCRPRPWVPADPGGSRSGWRLRAGLSPRGSPAESLPNRAGDTGQSPAQPPGSAPGVCLPRWDPKPRPPGRDAADNAARLPTPLPLAPSRLGFPILPFRQIQAQEFTPDKCSHMRHHPLHPRAPRGAGDAAGRDGRGAPAFPTALNFAGRRRAGPALPCPPPTAGPPPALP